jgi:hypothetical protein
MSFFGAGILLLGAAGPQEEKDFGVVAGLLGEEPPTPMEIP